MKLHQFTLTFLPDNVTITVPEDTTILDAQRQAGLKQDAPCGGMGTCGKCTVNILNGDVCGPALACTTRVDCDMIIEMGSQDAHHHILSQGTDRQVALNPAPFPDETAHYMAAFDIGTTTLVGYLLDANTGEELAIASTLNPQSQYGADVIMRANYVLEEGGEKLAKIIHKAVNDLLKELASQASISTKEIYTICCVGNSCMQHLFLELPMDKLALAPYTPAFFENKVLAASDYHLHIHPDGQLRILPNIGGFVGSDTVACLVATDFIHKPGLKLMIDIGTNGELVLGNETRTLSCSTAAGPAFEGAKITCGMRGAKGAIDHVTIQDGRYQYSVIDEEKPIGLCGSGLMDCIAQLVRLGFIDESGHLLSPDEIQENFSDSLFEQYGSKLKKIDNLWAFVLADESLTKTGRPVFVSQKDIREVQLAKSAIAAGIELLCKNMGVEIKEIDSVWIAGAFGNYMDFHSACAIGLLPAILEDRISLIGNAAGEGAKIALLNQDEFAAANDLIKQVDFIELANDPDFQDVFVDQLDF